MDKGALLDRLGAAGEERLILAKILDRAEQARNRNIPAATDFLSPAQLAWAGDLLRLAGFTDYAVLGGYETAERRLLLFLPDWLEPELWQRGEDCPLCALEAKVPAGAGLSHRDYLGSLMGLGLTREKLGDILLQEDGAQLLLLREVQPILLTQW